MIDLIHQKPVSLKAAAEYFGVSAKTVRCWSRGVGGRRLDTVKVGGLLFTTMEAIQAFAAPVGTERITTTLTTLERNYREASRLLREEHGHGQN